MSPKRIRPLALCLFTYQKRILVFKGFDPIKQQYFYRPLGGGIEFGESAKQTVHREIQEELGQKVRNIKYLFTLENIFTYNGELGHEIVLVYNGEFIDLSIYGKNLECREENVSYPAIWISLEDIAIENCPLYPDGLTEKLEEIFSKL